MKPKKKPSLIPAARPSRSTAGRHRPARERLLPPQPKPVEPIVDLKIKHDIAIIDPPWTFKTRSAKGAKKNPKYDVMDFDELRKLRKTVSDLLAKDAIVLLWSTAPQLKNAVTLLAEWGLEYKSYMIWSKDRQANGYWSRSNCEIVLVATRGRPKAPKRGTQGLSVFYGKPSEKKHSSKPAYLHEWVEKHYPDKRKLEVFARSNRDNWTCLGGDLGFWITENGVSLAKPGSNVVSIYPNVHRERHGHR